MSDDSDARRIEPPVVVKSFGDLDGQAHIGNKARREALSKRTGPSPEV